MGNGEKDKKGSEDFVEELAPQEAKRYRGAVALLNYYAQDCPELQYPAKEASKDMARPKEGSWKGVKRAVRFLLGREAVVWKFGWQEAGQKLTVFSDSDWGGSEVDRRSTSEGLCMYGKHCWQN